jgi:DNA-3-methyladenine glycosylase I
MAAKASRSEEKPVPTAEAKAAVKPAGKPAAKAAAKPALKPTQKPAVNAAAKSAAKPAAIAAATADSAGLVVGDDGLARPTWGAVDPLLRHYYDTEWGMPVRDERGLFERLALEGFQSGLSWATILRKREAFRAAFSNFDPDVVAAFDDKDVQRLLADAGIVRNRAKILATITNAGATVRLRKEGGLPKFLWSFKPSTTPEPRTIADIPTVSAESTAMSKALRAKGFAFVGPTTMYALMSSTGMVDLHLMGSHRRGCAGVFPR